MRATSMKGIAVLAGLLALLPLSVSAQDPEGPGGRRRGFGGEGMRGRVAGQLLAATADKDGSGDVTSAEWTSFLGSLKADDEGAIDGKLLKRAVFVGMLDRDKNRVLETGDLAKIFAELDKNGDETLQADEIGGGRGRGPRGEGRRGPPGEGRRSRRGGPERFQRMASSSLIRAADTDASGDVTSDEWKAFQESLKAGEKGVIPDDKVAELMKGGESRGEGRRRGGFGRMMDFMLGLRGDTPLNAEGLNRHFAALDTDGDGALSKEEMGPRRARGRDDGGEGRGRGREEEF